MLHNLFLDFLNRDSRQIYGLKSLPRETHLPFLIEALTIAVFLCRDYCLLPLGFLAESRLCREVLLGRRPEYRAKRLVRLSIKEYGLDEFWKKKQRQYQPFREEYEGLFDPKNYELLRGVSGTLIPRSTDIAKSILTGWEAAPDANAIWHERIQGLGPGTTERVRIIPRQILDSGIAVTWPAIAKRLTEHIEISRFRHVLQNVYFAPYLREYDLRVITGLPYATHSFVTPAPDVAYDYDALRSALSVAGIWDVIVALSAPSIIYLRNTGGYIRFRDAFDAIAKEVEGFHEVWKIYTLAAEANTPSVKFRAAVQRNSLRVAPLDGVVAPEPDLDDFAERLSLLTENASEIFENLRVSDARAKVARRKRMVRSNPKEVAIFVALEMERKNLIDRWHLVGGGREQVWRGDLGNARVSVYSPDEVGRVPAAVATMQFLCKNKPDLLLVAGIAGGFQQESVSLGNVLIAKSIVDLASRKVHPTGNNALGFRPKEFPVDDRVANYLNASFDKRAWELSVLTQAEWPDDRRPAIQFGSLVSLDEVVANAEFVEKLCTYWPKLLGIEMEAAGVCAAAETFNIRAAVMRGVSDLADPSKSDDEWRRRAMKTVAHLIESFNFDVLLS